MKTKITYFTIIILFFASIIIPQKQIYALENKTVEISLPSIQCNMCVETIETKLKKVKGVISAVVDLENKKVTVVYDDYKTNLSKLEKAITKVGYDANDKTGDPKAYDDLPGCCKKP